MKSVIQEMNARIFILLAGLAVPTSFAQGTFQNLNFEGTTLPYLSNQIGGFVSASDAFPGWTIVRDQTAQMQVVYNGVFSGSAIDLWTREFAAIPTVPPSFGNFSALIQASSLDPVPVSLSQVGMIPNGVSSLVFETFGSGIPVNINNLQIAFGNNLLPLEMMPTADATRFLWRADLGTFAGQTDELRITAISQFGNSTSFRIDNFQFANIPEPSTWALLAVGSLALWCAARRRRK